MYSGYNRRVSYAYTHVSLNLSAGDSIPFGISLISFLVGQVSHGAAGAIAPPITAVSLLTGLNNSVEIHYQLSVNLADKRTFMRAPGIRISVPDESGGLLR